MIKLGGKLETQSIKNFLNIIKKQRKKLIICAVYIIL